MLGSYILFFKWSLFLNLSYDIYFGCAVLVAVWAFCSLSDQGLLSSWGVRASLVSEHWLQDTELRSYSLWAPEFFRPCEVQEF